MLFASRRADRPHRRGGADAPSKSVMDMEVSSVRKEIQRTRSSPPGCSRDVIAEGAQLGWS